MPNNLSNAQGVYAIATTPFLDNGEIDFNSVDKLSDYYLECGSTGITILGVMGEAPKLNLDEQKKLVKRYINLDEMTEDNDSPVFVDKKYDETPYDIGEEWKRNNSILIASADDNKLVIEALKSYLMENNGLDEEKAEVDAAAMIYGSREVQEGEYAYLDMQGDGNIKYYVRQNNVWRYDKSLSGLGPEQINFCNIKQNCFKIKETCTNLDTTKDMLKMNILEDIEKRFEDELIKSIEQLKGDLNVDLQFYTQNLHSLKKLKVYKMIKRDLLQQKIASTLEERDIIVSPYESLKNIILAETEVRIKRLLGLNRHDKVDTPFAVVLGKCDSWINKEGIGEIKDPIVDGKLDLNAVESNSNVVRSILEEHCPYVVANAERISSDVRYFATSAFGHTPLKFADEKGVEFIAPDPSKIKPMFIEIPTMWALSKVMPEIVPSFR